MKTLIHTLFVFLVFSLPLSSLASEREPFVSLWRVSTNAQSLRLPLVRGFRYSFTVDWGDGTIGKVTSVDDPNAVHVYEQAGEYTLTIRGLLEAWSLYGSKEADMLLEVTNLGDVGWKSLRAGFMDCKNLTVFKGGNTSGVFDMSWMFAYSLKVAPDTSRYDTSRVLDMSSMFSESYSAKPDTSKWDTSRVVNMTGMFDSAHQANPDTSNWDTSNVREMDSMFFDAREAKPDTSKWNTSRVEDMGSMFDGALIANPDTSNWDTSNVKFMDFMFSDSRKAFPDTSRWNTSNVVNMSGMFYSAWEAQPKMNSWDFSKVKKFNAIFYDLELSSEIYSVLLVKLSKENPYQNLYLNAGYSQYNDAGEAARKQLLARGWEIDDGGRE